MASNATRTSNFIFGSNAEALNTDFQPGHSAAINQRGFGRGGRQAMTSMRSLRRQSAIKPPDAAAPCTGSLPIIFKQTIIFKQMTTAARVSIACRIIRKARSPRETDHNQGTRPLATAPDPIARPTPFGACKWRLHHVIN
jgi:hypothetical protein